MRTKIVSSKEIKESPTRCMSVHRMFQECHKCPTFKYRFRKELEKIGDIDIAFDHTLKSLNCNPRIKEAYRHQFKLYIKQLKIVEKMRKKLETF